MLPQTQLLSDQLVSSSSDLSTDTAWTLPHFNEANVTCHITCNDEEIESELYAVDEAKSCVGTFKVGNCSVSHLLSALADHSS